MSKDNKMCQRCELLAACLAQKASQEALKKAPWPIWATFTGAMEFDRAKTA